MGVISSLVGFLVVFGCFVLGALQILKVVGKWREDSMSIHSVQYVYVDEDDNEVP